MLKVNSVFIIVLICSLSVVMVKSIKCYNTFCDKIKGQWSCTAGPDEINNCDTDDDFNMCHEDNDAKQFIRGCFRKEDLRDKEIEEVEKHGQYQFKMVQGKLNLTVWYCSTPLCNNQLEFPKDHVVDPNHFEKVHSK